ncbi:FadR/GntR family transcriptional regulator [Ornithinimicrobium faecis]|uniref:FadR/GntR family transcriptional regulator n=1 Tax=Ornithinimicrobium faecis TaxID=2934158 RepID=UPI002119B636|nr:GntR family transcriptional regulator [Ornithinimicrobium sp. HY1745]
MTASPEARSHALPQSQRRYEAVVDGILEMVETDEIQPGQALPTERELATVFGVSRNVLRQAFGVLEERGLLRTVRGSGRYLREAADGSGGTRASVEVASIADVLEARTLIEVEVARLACDRRTGEQAKALTAMARRLTSWEDNLEFHCAVAAATQNFVLERLVREQALLSGELHQRDHYSDPEQLNHMRREHQEIAAAIAVRDADAATELTKLHLQRTKRVVFEAALGADSDADD